MPAPKVEKRTITPRAAAKRRASVPTREEKMIASLSPTLNIMVQAVRKAGRRLVRDFGEVANLQISQKAPGDFVSTADKTVEKILIETLSEARPDYGIISEESAQIPPKNGSACSWIIDPIDGTNNFIHAIACFSISVALMSGKEVIAGVSFNPITNELYYAEKGKGAFVMTPTGNQRLRVSGRRQLDVCMMGINGLFFKSNQNLMKKLIPYVASVRCNGSTALALADVASGRYDLFFDNGFKIWDVATGVLLVKEAGGFIGGFSDYVDLETLVKNQKILACNMKIKEPLLALV